jgi:tRNA modification GTPase
VPLPVFSTTDTIAAIATPAGRGALGIVRLSGPDAVRIAREVSGRTRPFAARRATLVRIPSSADGPPDQAIATCYPGPHSYTGEDCVEISVHGSAAIVGGLLRAMLARGARQAGPGEFTFRAYVNGRLDLAQAEAVADLTTAVTERQARAAFEQLDGRLSTELQAIGQRVIDVVALLEASLDFPEEGYHFGDPGALAQQIEIIRSDVERLLRGARGGLLLRQGAVVAITGRPNTGKSSLFNKLLANDRAIVSPIAGTTRDVLTESFDLNGLPVTLVDTAGQHATDDRVEREGVGRAAAAAGRADVELLVLDASAPLTPADRALLAAERDLRLVVLNKCDLPNAWQPSAEGIDAPALVSARTGAGLDLLLHALESILGSSVEPEIPAVTNERHVALLRAASDALSRASVLAKSREPEEVVAFELGAARDAFDAVTGVRTPDDVLRVIFERFCIGK